MSASSAAPPRPDPDARFERLLERAERLRVGRLGFDELRELGRLYRSSAARLARLRDRGDDPEAIRHLNALCVRAYGILYASRRPRVAARPAFLARLAAALAKTWRAQSLAWSLLLLGMLLGFALGARDPDAVYALVPAPLGYGGGGLSALLAPPRAPR